MKFAFIPDNDYRGFLKRRIEGLEETVKGGNFVTVSGKIVRNIRGTHFIPLVNVN